MQAGLVLSVSSMRGSCCPRSFLDKCFLWEWCNGALGKIKCSIALQGEDIVLCIRKRGINNAVFYPFLSVILMTPT